MNFAVVIILIVGLFLRFHRLDELMQFIPDQGWFYLSARDMILTGEIPLVGPQTSHPWIHHGALWTYVLGIILWVFNFNPIAPAYFIAILGVLTIFLFYITLKSMFNQKVAFLGSILYSTSPLVVMNARMPYHTSLIPFFVILLFFLTYKWIKGNVWFFPVITFLLGVLYNLEITTFVYFIAVGIIIGFGYIKKEPWFKKLIHKKLIFTSIISFLIPMIPFILYDISHGWQQTLGFLVWVVWRTIKFPLSLFDQSFISPGSSPSTLSEFFSYYQQLIFAPHSLVSIMILFMTAFFVFWYFTKNLKKNVSSSHILLFLFLSVGLIGLSIHRAPIEADTLLISPFIIILTILSLLWIFKNSFGLVIITIVIFSSFNIWFLESTAFFTKDFWARITFSERMKAVYEIISISKGQPYKLIGKGELSDFPAFIAPYEYLLWWKGQPPRKESSKLKVVIWEKKGNITVYQNK